MMKNNEIYDQHVHSYYSPDSDETLENIVKTAVTLGKKAVVTTDHFDYDCKSFHRDVVVDMPRYTAEVGELQKKYDIKILKGVEVGFRRDYLEEITAYLDRHSFDIVLLSVHNNGVLDYAETSFHEQSLDKCFLDYFSRLYEALISMDNYDVIAHLDYFLRYTSKKVTEEDFRRNRSLIYDILKTIIEKEKVLELNTAGLYRQGWIHPHPYVLNMYLDLGGRLFSLGSDAHQIEHYERGFDQAIDLLKSHGIYETVVFRNRRPYMVPI